MKLEAAFDQSSISSMSTTSHDGTAAEVESLKELRSPKTGCTATCTWLHLGLRSVSASLPPDHFSTYGTAVSYGIWPASASCIIDLERTLFVEEAPRETYSRRLLRILAELFRSTPRLWIGPHSTAVELEQAHVPGALWNRWCMACSYSM